MVVGREKMSLFASWNLLCGVQNASVISEPYSLSLTKLIPARTFASFFEIPIRHLRHLTTLRISQDSMHIILRPSWVSHKLNIMDLTSIKPPIRVLIRTRLAHLQKIHPSLDQADTELIKKLCDKLSITDKTKIKMEVNMMWVIDAAPEVAQEGRAEVVMRLHLAPKGYAIRLKFSTHLDTASILAYFVNRYEHETPIGCTHFFWRIWCRGLWHAALDGLYAIPLVLGVTHKNVVGSWESLWIVSWYSIRIGYAMDSGWRSYIVFHDSCISLLLLKYSSKFPW